MPAENQALAQLESSPLQWLKDYDRNDVSCKLVAVIVFLLLNNNDPEVRGETTKHLHRWTQEAMSPKGIEDIIQSLNAEDVVALIEAKQSALGNWAGSLKDLIEPYVLSALNDYLRENGKI